MFVNLNYAEVFVAKCHKRGADKARDEAPRRRTRVVRRGAQEATEPIVGQIHEQWSKIMIPPKTGFLSAPRIFPAQKIELVSKFEYWLEGVRKAFFGNQCRVTRPNQLANSGTFEPLNRQSRGPKFILCQQVFYDFALYVGQPKVTSLVFEGQLGVVDAEDVKDRRLQVVDVNWVLDDVVTVVVCLTVHHSWLAAAAGQPHREAARAVAHARLTA